MNTRTTGIAALLLCGAGLVAAVALDATDQPPAHEQQVGVFSGEFVDGVPVYRFPTITVIADREAEGEAAVARARVKPAKGAVRQPT